jgi:hypothetical protein
MKRRWWNKPIKKGNPIRLYGLIFVMVIAVLVKILWSPIARIWFGSLILGSVLVAVFLHLREKNSEH